MEPAPVIAIIGGYFVVLLVIARITSKKANTEIFFTASRQSPWFVVAFGMIGASLSGITFISVPGEVGNSGFAYFQVVIGYLLGYLVIGRVLLPLYYKLNLVSIYTYLQLRFGNVSYRTGSLLFLISRVIGASFRLFLVAGVLHLGVFRAWGVPFPVTVAITIILIWVYTFRGGIKTIVWTDTLQTLFMLLSVIFSTMLIARYLDISALDIPKVVADGKYAHMFIWDWQHPRNFFKQFFSGAFIAIVMTGLDQDMMQKNLTCKNLGEAQKNMFWFSIILVFVNLLFLSLGAMLYLYADARGIALPANSDDLYPLLALRHLSTLAGVLFLLGITAAAYSSADSALTALTTAFCVDFLNFKDQPESYKRRTRIMVHIGFSLIILLVIIVFNTINDESVINALFIAAGYTYGPLLGLFAFGLFTRMHIADRLTPVVCVLSPLLTYIINLHSETLLNGYRFGFELLILNGALTFLGLWVISLRKPAAQKDA
jgi:Na+/proline symporter